MIIVRSHASVTQTAAGGETTGMTETRSVILTKNTTITIATIKINITVSIRRAMAIGITISQGDKTSITMYTPTTFDSRVL